MICEKSFVIKNYEILILDDVVSLLETRLGGGGIEYHLVLVSDHIKSVWISNTEYHEYFSCGNKSDGEKI